MNFPFDEYAVSGEFGRINPLPADPLVERIICPKMVFNKQTVDRPTMSVQQCLSRIEANNDCVNKCHVAKQLKQRLSKRSSISPLQTPPETA